MMTTTILYFLLAWIIFFIYQLFTGFIRYVSIKFAKTIPENQIEVMKKVAEKLFQERKYLPAIIVYEKLEKTKYFEFALCKQICKFLLQGQNEVLQDLCKEFYAFTDHISKIPRVFYERLIDRLENDDSYPNECLLIVTCYQK